MIKVVLISDAVDRSGKGHRKGFFIAERNESVLLRAESRKKIIVKNWLWKKYRKVFICDDVINWISYYDL